MTPSNMESWERHELPNGELVMFNADEHTYIVRDQVVPSVTTLLQTVYGNPYTGVNPETLDRAARYGTAVHSELESLVSYRQEWGEAPTPEMMHFQEVQNYFTYIEPIYQIVPQLLERVVVLYDAAQRPVSAGRFDMLCTVAGKPCLADFKTTSAIHRPQVTAQLNLYRRAAEQSGYLTQVGSVSLGVIHLHGETSRFFPIPILGENFLERFIPS